MKKIGFLLIICLWIVPIVAYTQGDDTCPVIVATAFETTDNACQQTGRNQACYGNITLLAEAREGFDEFTFEQQGDMVDVIALQTLTLSSMDTDTEEWGVALMKIQANLPDTIPGQNVTLVLFGDVEIENAVEAPTDGEEDEESLTPMQAFFFRSGIGDAPCEGAPDSGILIQTPESAQSITFTVNEVSITLASTAYLQAQPGGNLVIKMVDGNGSVEALGVTQVLSTAEEVRVPLNNDLRAVGPPSPPEPYDDNNTLQAIPISLLPLPITIAPALTVEEVDAAQNGGHGDPLGDTTSCDDPNILADAPKGDITNVDVVLNADGLQVEVHMAAPMEEGDFAIQTVLSLLNEGEAVLTFLLISIEGEIVAGEETEDGGLIFDNDMLFEILEAGTASFHIDSHGLWKPFDAIIVDTLYLETPDSEIICDDIELIDIKPDLEAINEFVGQQIECTVSSTGNVNLRADSDTSSALKGTLTPG